MENLENTNEQESFLVVVARSETPEKFIEEILELLDDVMIEGVHSLNEPSDVDKKDRFLAFLSTTKVNKTEEMVNELRGNAYGANAFDNADDAMEHAVTKYGFEKDDEKRAERRKEFYKRFPKFTAAEIEQIHIFDSLYQTGKVTPIRVRYKDEEAIALVHMTFGVDEYRVTPMMLLIDDDISEEIELPNQ